MTDYARRESPTVESISIVRDVTFTRLLGSKKTRRPDPVSRQLDSFQGGEKARSGILSTRLDGSKKARSGTSSTRLVGSKKARSGISSTRLLGSRKERRRDSASRQLDF